MLSIFLSLSSQWGYRTLLNCYAMHCNAVAALLCNAVAAVQSHCIYIQKKTIIIIIKDRQTDRQTDRQYSTVQYRQTDRQTDRQYSTVQYSTVQYSTVQYSTVQYSSASDVRFKHLSYKLLVS